jgi:hypothetical protein
MQTDPPTLQTPARRARPDDLDSRPDPAFCDATAERFRRFAERSTLLALNASLAASELDATPAAAKAMQAAASELLDRAEVLRFELTPAPGLDPDPSP